MSTGGRNLWQEGTDSWWRWGLFSTSWVMHPDTNSHCGKLWEREALLVHTSPRVIGPASVTTDEDWSTPRLISAIFHQRNAHDPQTLKIPLWGRCLGIPTQTWACVSPWNSLFHGSPPPLTDSNWGNHFDHRYQNCKNQISLLDPRVVRCFLSAICSYLLFLFRSFPYIFS